METVAIVLETLLFYWIIRSAYRLFLLVRTAKKIREQVIKSEANSNNAEVATKPVVAEEMVYDPVCGCSMPRSKSYIVVKDDKEYYFCSWDCREKFLNA